MSNNTDIEYVKLEDLNYFWLPNGAPCFIANNYSLVDDICEVIESFGFQIYYLITDKQTRKTVQQKNEKNVLVSTEVYEYTPAVLKVVNNFTGRAIMDSDEPFGNEFCPVEEVAEYKMPAIPRVIIDKLDEFFRLVHSQHGTESIVILTYDTTKEGSDGWGVLVPDQTNTSAHCKYDADSIAEIKPDHVMIVGSVHSHPEMPAYASGTDHEDQADFDGIHITYGWQKSVNGGATQYHIELQIGGSAYKLTPDDVFESYQLNKNPDPEVVEWSSKVKKAQPLYTGGTQTQHTYPAVQQYYPPAINNPTPSLGHTPLGIADTPPIVDNKSYLTNLVNVEPDAVVAFEHEDRNYANSDCLICSFPLTELDINSAFCMTCDSPLVTPEMGRFEIISMLHGYCDDRGIEPTVPFYLYCKDESNYGSYYLINLKPAGVTPEEDITINSKDTYLPSSDSLDEDDDDLEIYNIGTPFEPLKYTLCCNLPYTMIDDCSCPTTVLETHIANFDDAHGTYDIYSNTSSCKDCVNYYQHTCPAFRKAIVDYMTNATIFNGKIDDCEYYAHYTTSNQYNDNYSWSYND